MLFETIKSAGLIAHLDDRDRLNFASIDKMVAHQRSINKKRSSKLGTQLDKLKMQLELTEQIAKKSAFCNKRRMTVYSQRILFETTNSGSFSIDNNNDDSSLKNIDYEDPPCEFFKEDAYSNKIIICENTYTINILLDINEDNKIYSFEVDIEEAKTIEEFIEKIIDTFNEINYTINKNGLKFVIHLSTNYSKYMIKKSKKKNKMPKEDFPPFSINSKIKDMGTRNVSLLLKDKDCIVYKNIDEVDLEKNNIEFYDSDKSESI